MTRVRVLKEAIVQGRFVIDADRIAAEIIETARELAKRRP